MAISFISAEDFSLGAAEEKKKDAPLHWGDLEETKIYAVLKLEKVSHPVYGDSYILHLQDQAGEIVKVWGPKRLSSKILEERPNQHNTFVASLGETKTTTAQGTIKRKYKWDITFQYDRNAVPNYLA